MLTRPKNKTPQHRIEAVRRSQARAKAGRSLAQVEFGGTFVSLLIRVLEDREDTTKLVRLMEAGDSASINKAASELVRLLEAGEFVIGKYDPISNKYIF